MPGVARWSSIVLVITLSSIFMTVPAPAATAIRLGRIFVTAMPAWIYNGFTRDSDGNNVQGSDVSPLRMTIGAGTAITLSERNRLEPQLWFYMQEYAALRDYDKTVPTQIETGVFTGDIANTLSIAISIPWQYTLPWPRAPEWDISAGLGAALIFRIPIEAIDGSKAGKVGAYWIDGRYIYPQVNLSLDYRLNERYSFGGGVEWFIPIYNGWAQSEPAPFLDETMIRMGLRINRILP